jgi:flagellin-like hook-associated protein FlgL
VADAANLTTAKFANADAIVLTASGGGGAQTYTVSTGMSLATLAATIDAHADFVASVETSTLNGVTVSKLKVTAASSTATLTYADNGNTTMVAKMAGTTVAGGATGYDSGDTVGGSVDMTTGDIAAASTGAPTDSTLVTQYNAIRTQIDQMVLDAGYRGTNLLNSNNLVTQFNEGNTASQTVTGVNMATSGLLNLTLATFADATAIDADIVKVNTALTTLRTQAKSFGNSLSVIQSRQDFTNNLVGVLKDGASALTLADKNEEGANMLALQTSQQLGIQALSLASQANQSVLRLFQ